MLKKRLEYYFEEAYSHIDKIQKANIVLEKVISIDIDRLENLTR